MCQEAVVSVPIVDGISSQTTPHSAGEDACPMDTFNYTGWKAEQGKDKAVARHLFLRGTDVQKESPAVEKYLRERRNLVNGVLYRNASLDGQVVKQLVLPEASRRESIMMSGTKARRKHYG